MHLAESGSNESLFMVKYLWGLEGEGQEYDFTINIVESWIKYVYI